MPLNKETKSILLDRIQILGRGTSPSEAVECLTTIFFTSFKSILLERIQILGRGLVLFFGMFI